jgi:hypothetical protein
LHGSQFASRSKESCAKAAITLKGSGGLTLKGGAYRPVEDLKDKDNQA